jgi:hypothetical protein
VTDSDESIEPTPPSAEAVARRALIIEFQIEHAMSAPDSEILHAIGTWAPGEMEQLEHGVRERQQQLLATLRETGLWEDASPQERVFFETTPTQLSQRQLADTSWRLESEACLAWALQLTTDIPPFDEEAERDEILPTVATERPVEFIRDARLRPKEQIAAARDRAQMWHWRARTRLLAEEGYEPGPEEQTLDDIVREVAPRASADGLIPPPIDGDFPAYGVAYRDLPPEQYLEAMSIARERHFVLNWLCGYAPDNEWHDTPTDT